MWPLNGRSLIVMITLGISAAVSIVTAVTAFATKDYVQGVAEGLAPDLEYGQMLDLRRWQLGRVTMVVFVVSAIAFLSWVHKAADNLKGAGLDDLRFTPGAAVLSFLIPIVWFFKPCQVTGELWRGSANLANDSDEEDVLYGPIPSIIVSWWVVFWISRLVTVFVVQIRGDVRVAPTLDVIVNIQWLSIGSSIASVLAAFLAVSVVRRVTEMQEQAIKLRAEARLRAGSVAEPPPVPPQATDFHS